MKKFFGLAMVPVLLAATPMLALAEQSMPKHDQHSTTQKSQTQTTQTRAQSQQTTTTPARSTTTTTTTTTMTRATNQNQAMAGTTAVDPRINPQWARGQWDLVTRHYPEAISTFQTILATEPNNVHALEGLSLAYHYQGRYDEAMTQVNRALALDPVNPRLFYTKGMIQDAQDRPMEAIESYLTFTSLNPDDGAAIPALRRVDELQKRIQPQLSQAQENYYQGLRLLSLHQPDQAIPLLDRFHTLEPTNMQGNLMLGRAYVELGQPEKAIPLFESALRTNANSPMAYYQLGTTYDLRGQTQNAQDAWRKFLQAAPQSEHAMIINRRMEWHQH